MLFGIPVFGNIHPEHLPAGYKSGGRVGFGVGKFINNTLRAVILAAGLGALVYLLYGGIRFLTAGGDEKALSDASKIITNAVIGLLIIVTVYFLVEIVESVLGINILAPSFVGPD